MRTIVTNSSFSFWACSHTWRRSSLNTLVCLAGCSIGDIGTILVFQLFQIQWPMLTILSIAIVNGLVTSIALETWLLSRKMSFRNAFHTACGMSLLSMLAMELAMNIVDVAMMGGAKISLHVLPYMLFAGFITPLPYNYWRLKSLGKACH